MDESLADLQPVVPDPAAAAASPPPVPQPTGSDADIIDHMIDRLQREQDERLVASGQEPLLSPRSQATQQAFPTPSTSRDHSSGQDDDPQPGPSSSSPETSQESDSKNISVWHKRICVHILNKGLLKQCQDFMAVMSENETKNFVFQRKKKPLLLSEVSSQT